MTLDTGAALQRLAVALMVGLLLGLDRERTERAGRRFAGIRTFPLIAISGALATLLREPMGPLLLVVSFVAVVAVAVVSYARSAVLGEVGATTEIAAIVAFLLGVVAGTGQLVMAGAAGVGVAVLLAAKVRLERFSRALSTEELWAVLELAVISVIVLPLLPRTGFGPWQVFNPFEIWLVVVLVTALSFSGFVAMRLLGDRKGLVVTGFIGGVVSSTAMTLSMAERSRGGEALARPTASAAVLASTVMCARVAVLAGVVNVGILALLLPTLLTMGAVGLLAARLVAGSGDRELGPPVRRLVNPFSLRAAITFAVVYALVKLAVRGALEYLGNTGMLVAATLSGAADMDAPTIAFARLGPLADSWRVPATAVALAAVSNTLVKLGLAVGLGSGAFRRFVAISLAAMALAGGIAAAVVYAR